MTNKPEHYTDDDAIYFHEAAERVAIQHLLEHSVLADFCKPLTDCFLVAVRPVACLSSGERALWTAAEQLAHGAPGSARDIAAGGVLDMRNRQVLAAAVDLYEAERQAVAS